MGEVSVSVAGRAYHLVCEDGEEDRLRALASRIDAEAAQFRSSGAAVPEARLLLMSALMLADKLEESEAALEAAQAGSAPPAAPPSDPPADGGGQLGMFTEDEIDRAEAIVQAATDRIAALTPDAGPTRAGEEKAASNPRQRKSSAASEAERDLLAWLNKPEPQPAPSQDEPGEPAEAQEIERAPTESAAPEAGAEALGETPQSEMAEENATDAEGAADPVEERRARRAARRARLARLAAEQSEENG